MIYDVTGIHQTECLLYRVGQKVCWDSCNILHVYTYTYTYTYIYIYTHAYTFSDFLPNYNYYTLLEDIEFSNSKFFWTPFLDTIESPGNSSEKQCSIGGS